MPTNTVILAIDHGTSGIKAALVSPDGQVLDFEYRATSTQYLPGGGAEQDPQEWWDAVISTSQALVSRWPEPVEQIRAVCVSSTFSSTVAVGCDGKHLGPSLTWMDSRGARYIHELMGGFPSISGYGVANLLRWIPRTGGGPTRSGKDDVAHVLLWKHEHPGLYRDTYKFLPSKDYLNLRFCGEFAASYDSIALFWVTDNRKVDRVVYDNGLIRRLGLDRAKLPELRSSTDVLGAVTDAVADEIGLVRETPVVMGAADHQAALVGSGAVRDFEGHLYVGTSSWVQCAVPFKKTDLFHSIASLPAAIPGRYQCVNEQDIAGGSLDFLLRDILYYKNRLLAGEPPENPYKDLDEIVARVPAGSGKVIFTPWINGERTPVEDETLRGGLYNLSTTTNQEHILRAVFEGVAYNTRWSLGYVEKFIGRKMPALNMIGGGACSDVWCQIFADVLDREIRQVEDPRQANARGAGFIGAVGLGLMSFDDIPGRIQIRATYRPNAANRAIYDQLFTEFKRIYHANRDIFRRLNRADS